MRSMSRSSTEPVRASRSWETVARDGLWKRPFAMYWATQGIDRTRPVIDASGYSHRVRDEE